MKYTIRAYDVSIGVAWEYSEHDCEEERDIAYDKITHKRTRLSDLYLITLDKVQQGRCSITECDNCPVAKECEQIVNDDKWNPLYVTYEKDMKE